MATELLVVTTDTEYWHASCYVEEICAKPQFLKFISECSTLFTGTVAKPVKNREQLFVIALKNTANMAKKVNRSLGDIELFDLSIEVKSDFQSCKDDLGVIVHLLVETIASLGANFSMGLRAFARPIGMANREGRILRVGSTSPRRRDGAEENGTREEPKKKKERKEKEEDGTDHPDPEIAEVNKLRASLGLKPLK
ncbi:hypothetical protein CMV_015120 [Castanea mollissima]|uniref:Uncharacterized protein n=1 Tax=Castanea mollissima TaxID=60419 RepID=A0A8J4R293_9ROSI|nr:hypothetical protein CMV_015120 [Castanea mollissima]